MAGQEYERLKTDPPSVEFCLCATEQPEKIISHLTRLAVKYRCFKQVNGQLPAEGVTVEEACSKQNQLPEFEDKVQELGHSKL